MTESRAHLALWQRRTLLWGGYALVLALAPQVWHSSLGLSLLSQAGVAIIACLSYNLLFGQGGMLSFGHAVYTGLGAYLAIHTLNLVSAGQLTLPVSLVPLAGGLAGLACAALLGWVTTRKAGTPFAMITLGLGELVWALSLMLPEVFGGEAGISGNRVAGAPVLGVSFGPQIEVYYLIALYCFLSTVALYAFTGTPLGRLLNAVRDNPERVGYIGYSARQIRYLALLVAGFFAGVAGGLGALNFEIVTPDVLGAARSGAYLLFVVVGGSTWFAGPILGALLMVLALVLLSELTRAWLLYLGLIFLLVVIWAPGGLASLLVLGWRLAVAGQLRRLWAGVLALAGSGAAALLGLAALVEMVYHRQLDASLGPQLRFLGLLLDVRSAGCWGGALLLALAGAGLFALVRRRLAGPWRHALAVLDGQAQA